jgi:hypothetical protein
VNAQAAEERPLPVQPPAATAARHWPLCIQPVMVRALPGKAATARRAGLTKMSTAAASDGTPYHHQGAYGYAVRHGWAIVAPNIRWVVEMLAKRPHASLATVPAYQRAIPARATPSSIWYVDLTGLRRSLEAAILPIGGPSQWKLYDRDYRPMVKPLLTLSGSAGTHGSVGYSTVAVDIGASSGS